jgi:hypothetical protein
MFRKFITIYALLHLTFSQSFIASFATDVDVDTSSSQVPYSPVNLLERLTQEQRKIPEFYFSDYVKNWIALADVQKIALRLDSKRKCLHVAEPWSRTIGIFWDSNENEKSSATFGSSESGKRPIFLRPPSPVTNTREVTS